MQEDVMIKEFDIKKHAETVLFLQRSAYKVEAEYIGSDDIPPLKESLKQLIECGEKFIGYFAEAELAGVLSYKYKKGVIDIHRVMVHPRHFRKGIAGSLVSYIERKLQSAQFMIVSTGAKNAPAIELYMKSGFEKIDDTTYGDGIVVTNFKKKIKRDK
jgi:ribosomal protein S18 acetylase RimI-like enzyme